MSKHNKVNPDHYKIGSREQPGTSAAKAPKQPQAMNRERERFLARPSKRRQASTPDESARDQTRVPLPGQENEAERRRIRSSNDRDQQLEREGRPSRHNRGYDDAADGPDANAEIERVVDED